MARHRRRTSREAGVDLRYVIKVVHGPRREELAQRHFPERRVQARTVEVVVRCQRVELREVVRPQLREPVNQRVERRVHVALHVGEAVERVECRGRAVLEDQLRSRDPVGELAADQVADHITRAPAIRDVGCGRPGLGQPCKERSQHNRRPLQQVPRVAEEIAHSGIDGTPTGASPDRRRRRPPTRRPPTDHCCQRLVASEASLPAYAASSSATSSFDIWSIASIARCAPAGSDPSSTS